MSGIEQSFEVGPPDEVIIDNYPSFRTNYLSTFMSKWNTNVHFRCAHKASGNGIGERNHRTVKKIAAKSKIEIEEAVFWYNATPRKDGNLPCELFLNRHMRMPFLKGKQTFNKTLNENFGLHVGETVFVKPAENCRCTEQWKKGVVTKLPDSKTSIEVDSVPRHVSHIRRVPVKSSNVDDTKNQKKPNNIDFEVIDNQTEIQTVQEQNLNDNSNSDDSNDAVRDDEGWIRIGSRGKPIRKPPDIVRYGVIPY